MKKTLLLAAAVFAFVACNKSSAHNSVTLNIVGKWKLAETLADPGDGSGTWHPVDPLNPVFLEFKEDGSLVSSGTYTADHFKLINDSTINFYSGRVQITRYIQIINTELTITGACDEPCGERYIPVH